MCVPILLQGRRFPSPWNPFVCENETITVFKLPDSHPCVSRDISVDMYFRKRLNERKKIQMEILLVSRFAPEPNARHTENVGVHLINSPDALPRSSSLYPISNLRIDIGSIPSIEKNIYSHEGSTIAVSGDLHS